MNRRVLVAYATKRGSTREVAESVSATLRAEGFQADCRPAAEVEDLDGYAGVVLGGALYMGRWHPDARDFLKRHRRLLAIVRLAVFAMGPRTLAESDVEESHKQLDNALAMVPELEPVSVAVFGGVVDPAKLRFPFNRMPASDARDWDAIHVWAQDVAAELRSREGVVLA